MSYPTTEELVTGDKYVLTQGKKRVVWEWIGEGEEGDYNEGNPDDTPYLRFSCDHKVGRSWEGMDDASYCTLMPYNTPENILVKGAEVIMSAIMKESYKKRLEELSWLNPSDFKDEDEN